MKPTVYMMLGLPGSGKTTFSKKLAAELELPRYSLDEDYFARAGNNGQEHRDFEIEKQIGQEIKKRSLANLLQDNQSSWIFAPGNMRNGLLIGNLLSPTVPDVSYITLISQNRSY